MKVMLAPNAFKEGLSAPEAARAMEEGVLQAIPDAECILCPVADGGDGTLDALLEATDGHRVVVKVADPLRRAVDASYGLLGGSKTAVIEMAEASGLRLLKPAERNPLLATTLGTGELIYDALERGVQNMVIGIGGSATVDGGTGMARALGYRFLDNSGQPLPHGGGSLTELGRIEAQDTDPRLKQTNLEIASDVTNPLIGEHGAARVYGPQKGANPEMVELLERGLSRLAEIIERDLGIAVADLPGAGAAGGLGAGLIAFAGAKMRPGVELVLEKADFERKLQGCDLVLTGEGSVDRQTAYGKGPAGVAIAARKRGIPAFCLAGLVQSGAPEELKKIGIEKTCSINPPGSPLEQCLREAYPRLRAKTAELVKEALKR